METLKPRRFDQQSNLKRRIVTVYGLDYWNSNKQEILRIANTNNMLNNNRVIKNARQRRWERRHPEEIKIGPPIIMPFVFNVKSGRWHDVLTGRFIKNPNK